jgi:hypothetical protein
MQYRLRASVNRYSASFLQEKKQHEPSNSG